MPQFTKNPTEVNNFTIDWSDWLGDDTISTSTWSVPAGITEDSDSNTTTTATVVLSGGTAGTDYTLVNTIVTANGYTEDREMVIAVTADETAVATTDDGTYWTLKEARDFASEGVLHLPSKTRDPIKLDYALKMAGDEFVRRTRCTRGVDDSLNMTIDNAEVDYSSVGGFRPDRLVFAEALYPGGDAWATSTSYSEYDLVTSGGKFYIASQDHTSSGTNEPPNDEFWGEVLSDVSFRLIRKPYRAIAEELENARRDIDNPGVDFNYFPGIAGSQHFAFRPTDTNIILAFAPQVAWRIRLVYWEPFTDWTYGTENATAVTLNIPRDLMLGVLYHGVPTFFHRGTESNKVVEKSEKKFEQHILMSGGTIGGDKTALADMTEYD